jgi:Ca2+-binding EF-hand superfamily protein
MLRHLFLSLLVAAPTGAFAAGPTSADVQDLLFLAPDRPLLLRLHLIVEGKPAVDRWTAYLDRLFAFFDRDGDGYLDKDEAARIFTPMQMQQLFDGQFALVHNQAPPPLSMLDLDEDRKLSKAEFFAYYRKFDAGPVSVNSNFGQPIDDPLSQALFAALDTDGDGKLSAAELAAAPTTLHRLDIDDDEMISPGEILVSSAGPVWDPIGPRGPLLIGAREEGPRRVGHRMRIARDLLARYDRNGDQKLDPEEIALPADVFARLDTNGDGKLDVLELVRWTMPRPDAEVLLHLTAPNSGGPARASIDLMAKQGPWRRNSEYDLTMSKDDLQIHLAALPAFRLSPNGSGARQFYSAQFQTVDTEKRGFINRRQIREKNSPYLMFALDVADRDEDGKLTKAELDAFADLVEAAAGVRTSVALVVGGHSLFSLLDADGDGRLSVRELSGAAARLAPFANGGQVSLRGIPEQYQIRVSQGLAIFGSPFVPRPARGPLWFRKMDRNGDGDVSRREFLGSQAAFDRLDLDKDGLISVEEAERGDRELRKRGR